MFNLKSICLMLGNHTPRDYRICKGVCVAGVSLRTHIFQIEVLETRKFKIIDIRYSSSLSFSLFLFSLTTYFFFLLLLSFIREEGVLAVAKNLFHRAIHLSKGFALFSKIGQYIFDHFLERIRYFSSSDVFNFFVCMVIFYVFKFTFNVGCKTAK